MQFILSENKTIFTNICRTLKSNKIFSIRPDVCRHIVLPQNFTLSRNATNEYDTGLILINHYYI